MVRVGFYQFYPQFARVRENLSRTEQALAAIDADLLVLPELAFTGYFFENRRELRQLAEDPKNSQIVERLAILCRDKGFYLVTGVAEKARDRIFNSALLIGPGGLLHTYRKLHLFNTEKEYFDPGDRPLEVVSVRGLRLGIMICFDWAFPEVARVLAIKGADLLCHPSNLVLAHCQRAMVTRSLENGVFSITANRYGKEVRPRGELNFTGGSQIVDPAGKVLHRASADRDEWAVVEIDPEQARNKMITDRNDRLADRRPHYYRDLIQ